MCSLAKTPLRVPLPPLPACVRWLRPPRSPLLVFVAKTPCACSFSYLSGVWTRERQGGDPPRGIGLLPPLDGIAKTYLGPPPTAS